MLQEPVCLVQKVQLVKYTGQISITIPDFLIWLEIQSDDFIFWSEPLKMSCGKETFIFKIQLNLNKKADDDFEAYLMNCNDTVLKVEHTMTIPIKTYEKGPLIPRVNRAGCKDFFIFNGWGWKSFLSKKSLREKKDLLLPGGELAIVCNLTIYQSEVDTSHQSAKISNNLKSHLAESFRALWKKEVFTDFKLICEGKVYLCHKFVLASRSDIFEAMFSHKDTSEALTGEAVIKDCTPQVLSNFLEFLYTDELKDMKCCNLCDLMLLADKYNIPSLKKVCEENLVLNINCSNVFERLQVATMVTAPELLETAAKFIASHRHKLYGTNEWKTTIGKNPQALDAIIKFGLAQKQKPSAPDDHIRLGSFTNVIENVSFGILLGITIGIAYICFLLYFLRH